MSDLLSLKSVKPRHDQELAQELSTGYVYTDDRTSDRTGDRKGHVYTGDRKSGRKRLSLLDGIKLAGIDNY